MGAERRRSSSGRNVDLLPEGWYYKYEKLSIKFMNYDIMLSRLFCYDMCRRIREWDFLLYVCAFASGREKSVKIDRLIAIMNYLLCHGRTSAQRLAEVFEVSSRTIMRDMETLGQAGIPVQSTFGAEGGYEIIDTYIVDRKLMDNKDYAHIITALYALLSAYSDKGVKRTMEKVIPFYQNTDNPIRVDFSVAKEKRDINGHIGILENAIRQQRAVEFRYTNSENATKQVKAEPVRLEFKWYNWYLVAFSPKYRDYRMFKLIRMENVVILEEKNTVHHVQEDIVIQDERKVISVTLRGNAKIRSGCREYLNGEITKEYENGDFEFMFSVPENEVYWYGVVLSFGSNVTVLEPRSVIDRILATCDEVKEIYRKKIGG